MIEIITRPDREQQNNPALESQWLCARHPILFKIQRRDYTVISCNSDGFGAVVVKADYDANLPAEILAGDEIYFASELNAEGVPDYYGVVGTVVSVATTVGVEHLIYTTYPIEALSTGAGYLNVVKRANYYLGGHVALTDSNTLIQHQIPIKLKGGVDGNMRLDVSEFITTYLVKEAPDNYAFINFKDPDTFGKFSIVTQEFWTGSSESEVGDLTQYFFVDAVKYVNDLYGQNLCDYLMFPDEVDPLPKWLTDFDSPTFFAGYPFDLSFIYPDSMTGETLRRNEQEYNGQGTPLSSIQTDLDADQIGGVNRMTLTETYTAGTKSIDVNIDFNDGVDNIPLLESKRIKIGDVCGKNPVYLAWKNTKGGWSYWLFEKNQTIAFATKSGQIINREPDDLATQNFRSLVTQNEMMKKIVCGATVSNADLEGIKGIESSPAVYLFTGVSSYTWLKMIISPKGFQYQTKGMTSEIQIELNYPELYTVSN